MGKLHSVRGSWSHSKMMFCYRAPMNKLAYSIPEAAEIASTSVSVLRRKIAASELTVRYIGSKPVILAEELTNWLGSLPTEAPNR